MSVRDINLLIASGDITHVGKDARAECRDTGEHECCARGADKRSIKKLLKMNKGAMGIGPKGLEAAYESRHGDPWVAVVPSVSGVQTMYYGDGQVTALEKELRRVCYALQSHTVLSTGGCRDARRSSYAITVTL